MIICLNKIRNLIANFQTISLRLIIHQISIIWSKLFKIIFKLSFIHFTYHSNLIISLFILIYQLIQNIILFLILNIILFFLNFVKINICFFDTRSLKCKLNYFTNSKFIFGCELDILNILPKWYGLSVFIKNL